MFTKEFYEKSEKELSWKLLWDLLWYNFTKECYMQIDVLNWNSIMILISDYNKYWVKFIDCISWILKNSWVKNQSYIITKDDIELYRTFILNDYRI